MNAPITSNHMAAAPATADMPLTVGELITRFLEAAGVRAAFGVISIHNMPILDAFHRRGKIRFVSARGEAGACNMADACARVTGTLGVVVTSTGTGAGNAAGALVEAMTAGTPLLHLTGQIDSPYLDRDLGFIHEAPKQMAMLAAAGKAAFRISNPETALPTLREAVRIAGFAPERYLEVVVPSLAGLGGQRWRAALEAGPVVDSARTGRLAAGVNWYCFGAWR